jgi:hypothetical protein
LRAFAFICFFVRSLQPIQILNQKSNLKQPEQNQRESRLIGIPVVKSFGEPSLAVVSKADKSIYREIEETNKKESDSKRDEW